jgi:hypothetical protein
MSHHARARVTSVPTAWTAGPGGESLELLALVEGLADTELAGLLLAWRHRIGRPATVVGGPFALRLSVAVDAVPPGVQGLLRLDRELPLMGAVAEGGWLEQWFVCRGMDEAEEVAGRLREALRPVPDAVARIGSPRPRDLHCWEVLQYAGGLAPPLEG